MPTPIDEHESVDSIGRFVADLRSLYLEQPQRPTFGTLARMTHRSRSSLHAAVTYTTMLPSHATVHALVGALAPGDIAGWLERRQRLDPRTWGSLSSPEDAAPADPPATATDVTAPTTPLDAATPPAAAPTAPRVGLWSPARRRVAYTAAIIVALTFAAMLTAPFDRGGISTVAFCLGNYPRADTDSGQVAADSTWVGWHCELDDGRRVPVDMQLACRQQYPAAGPFGGAQYAVHTSQGFTSWRCYGSLIHNW